MRIHHLNCGSMCPLGGHLMDGFTKGVGPAHLVCHCLLIESEQGLILVDTGLGINDVIRPHGRISPFFRSLLRPKLHHDETAAYQVRARGFRTEDVRHIILTHLDFDHAGGIDDFPNAEVHLMQQELRASQEPKGFITRRRYSPAQLTQSKTWTTYQSLGEKWLGFEAVRELKGLPPEVLLVPLFGHTEGHAGIAVETNSGWLLHAGDAYFFRDEMAPTYKCTSGLRAYQTMMEVDRCKRQMNQRRLRELAATKKEVRIFSAHDAVEYEHLRSDEKAAQELPSTPLEVRS